MPRWRVEDIDQLLSNDRSGNNPLLEKARIKAFLLRRRLGVDLRDAPHAKKPNALGKKRHANTLARRIIVAAKRGTLPEEAVRSVHRSLLMARYRNSVLLGGLVSNRDVAWTSVPRRMKTRESRSITIKEFSFLSNPVQTLNRLADIGRAEAECLAATIDFDDSHCLDIGPWLVLSVMRHDMIPVFVGGTISNSMSKVVAALRLDHALGMQVRPLWGETQDIWAFPVRQRRPAGTSRSPTMQLEPQTKERVGDELCAAIDEWLSTCAKKELSRPGRRLVKTIIGETLDNAERHSNPVLFPDDGDWMVSGMMVRRGTELNPKFHCQLAFLSVGSSIAETIATCPPEIKVRMDAYVAAHRRRFRSKKLADGHLRTVFALQPGVTRDAAASDRHSGGTGFSDIMRLYAELAGIESEQNDARLAVVSGHTCIHIRYPHVRSGSGGFGPPQEVWFNEANQEADPPDQAYVIELENEFKGTLVTMAFTLDRDYLERTANG